MPVNAETLRLLSDRLAAAEERFKQAVALEVRGQITHEIEARGRSLEDFFPGFTPQGATAFHLRWEKATQAVIDTLWKQVTDLRIYYAAQHDSAAEGEGGLLKLLNEVVGEEAKKVMNHVFVPADSREYEGITNKYKVSYAPSTTVRWAWAEIRNYDTAFMQLDGAAKGNKGAPTTFEIKYCIPEAL